MTSMCTHFSNMYDIILICDDNVILVS